MAERYIPLSEDEQKFGALLERVLTDPKFASAMRERPVAALQEAGYNLSERDKRILETQRVAIAAEAADVTDITELSFPLTKPVVSILTKGTKPVVRVVTKGTQPAVSVAVNTVIAVQESQAPSLLVEKEEDAEKKANPSA